MPDPQRPDEVRQQTLDRVLRVILTNLNQRRAVVKLQLNPPELGRLIVDLRLDKDNLELRIKADRADVRDLLRSQADTLVAALREHGISVKRFEVIADPAQTSSEGQQQPFEGRLTAGLPQHSGSSFGGGGFDQPADESAGDEDFSKERPSLEGITDRAVDIRV